MDVQHILFSFDNQRLFGSYEIGRLDVEACASKFARLCRNALQDEYPDADIEVIYDYDPETNELLMTADSIMINGDRYSEEVGNVMAIIDLVRNRSEWTVQQDWLKITDASLRSGIPVTLIHWMCEHGVVSDAVQSSGVWELTPRALNELFSTIGMRAQITNILEVKFNTNGIHQMTFHPSSMLDTNLADCQYEMYVVQPTEALTSTFTPDNSRFVITHDENVLIVHIEHFFEEGAWHHPVWIYEIYVAEVLNQARRQGIKSVTKESSVGNKTRISTISLSFSHSYADYLSIRSVIDSDKQILLKLIQDVELALSGGPVWKVEYESNERLFCLEVLEPLLNKMGFIDVNYRGGRKEYGKDFTFAELTVFGEYRYYGLQAKDGDMSGRVNSAVDEIIGQLEDAFAMPYQERDSRDLRYISHFIVAISGDYTENALEKIREKVKLKGRSGSVYFWHRTKIQELIQIAWFSER